MSLSIEGGGTRRSLRSLPTLKHSMILHRRNPKFSCSGSKKPLFLERILLLIPSLVVSFSTEQLRGGNLLGKANVGFAEVSLSLFTPRLSYSIIIVVIIITHVVVFTPRIICKL